MHAEKVEWFFYGSDMENDSTQWDAQSFTATLSADRSIGCKYDWTVSVGLQAHGLQSRNEEAYELHAFSLVSFAPYSVAGATGDEKLTLAGDIASVMANSITVKDLNTLKINQGTYALDATYGNKSKNRNGGIYIENVKNVDISGTMGAIYGDIRAKVELTGIDTLSLASDSRRKKENYRGDATIDNTIFCTYGSEVDIDAKDTVLKANGRAIMATAGNAEFINESNGSWGTDTPFPVVRILSDTLTIAADTQGESAAAVYSDAGGIIQLGSKDRKSRNSFLLKMQGQI